MSEELFGRPVVRVEPQGEPISIEVGGPMLDPNEHAFLAEQKGVIQCLECGHWTRDGLAVLRTVACHKDENDGLTDEELDQQRLHEDTAECPVCNKPRQVTA